MYLVIHKSKTTSHGWSTMLFSEKNRGQYWNYSGFNLVPLTFRIQKT